MYDSVISSACYDESHFDSCGGEVEGLTICLCVQKKEKIPSAANFNLVAFLRKKSHLILFVG